MPANDFQSDQYLSRSWRMLTKEQGWTKPIVVLAFAQFIPLVGALGLLGYAHEWARLSAWGVDAVPKQRKVDIKTCIVSGVRGLVVALVWGVIYIALCGAVLLLISNEQLATFLIYLLLLFFGTVVSVAVLRATIYKKVSAGLNVLRVCEMIGHDFQGILRIVGIFLLFTVIAALLILIMTMIMILVGAVASAGALLSLRGATIGNLSTDEAMYATLKLMQSIGPLFPLVLFVIGVVAVLGTLVVTNALGLWMRQFSVSQWGSSSDPLPSAEENVIQTAQAVNASPSQEPTTDPTDAYVYAPAEQIQAPAELQTPDRSVEETPLGEGVVVPDPAQDPVPGTHTPDAFDLASAGSDAVAALGPEVLGDGPASVIDDVQEANPKPELHDPIPEVEPVSPTEELPLITEKDLVEPVLTNLAPLDSMVVQTQKSPDPEELNVAAVSVLPTAPPTPTESVVPTVAATAILVDDEPIHVVPEDELEAIALEQAKISLEDSVQAVQVEDGKTAAEDVKEALASLEPSSDMVGVQNDNVAHELLEDGSLVVPLIPLEAGDEVGYVDLNETSKTNPTESDENSFI